MTRSELKKLGFGLVIFVVSLFNALFYIMCDLGLYSALKLIETHFTIATKAPGGMKLDILLKAYFVNFHSRFCMFF